MFSHRVCVCVCLQLACRKAGYSSRGSRGSGMSRRNSLSSAATSWTLCSSSSWTSTPMSKSSLNYRNKHTHTHTHTHTNTPRGQRGVSLPRWTRFLQNRTSHIISSSLEDYFYIPVKTCAQSVDLDRVLITGRLLAVCRVKDLNTSTITAPETNNI